MVEPGVEQLLAIGHGSMSDTDSTPTAAQHGAHAEPSSMSLRSVSPRPHVEERPQGHGHKRNQSSLNVNDETSPTERRSIFQENM